GEDVLLRFIQVTPYTINTIWFYILLGIFTGLVAIYFTRMTMYLEGKFKQIKSWVFRMRIGGVIMGILVFLFPPLWGEGYEDIALLFNGKGGELLKNSLFWGMQDKQVVMFIFIAGILVFKVLAMVATTGSGGVGGVFAPTLFMGA